MQNLQFYKVRKKQLKLTNLLIAEKSGLPRRTVEDFFGFNNKSKNRHRFSNQ